MTRKGMANLLRSVQAAMGKVKPEDNGDFFDKHGDDAFQLNGVYNGQRFHVRLDIDFDDNNISIRRHPIQVSIASTVLGCSFPQLASLTLHITFDSIAVCILHRQRCWS